MATTAEMSSEVEEMSSRVENLLAAARRALPNELLREVLHEDLRSKRVRPQRVKLPASIRSHADASIHMHSAKPFLGPEMRDVRPLIWHYFMPKARRVPAVFPSAKWFTERPDCQGLINLLLVNKLVHDEVTMILYEQKQFELALDDKYITFLNKRVAHLLPRDEIEGRPEDRFGASQLHGFSRIKHLRLTVNTMFPRANDACRTNTTKYDVGIYGTVEDLVSLLCAPDLHSTQQGLATLEIVFKAGRKSKAADDTSPAPRQAHFQGSCKTGFALDFVLRPLATLRGVSNVTITFPGFTREQNYDARKTLNTWAARFSKDVKSQAMDLDGSPTQEKSVAFDETTVGDMSLRMLREAYDAFSLQKDYQAKFGGGRTEAEAVADSEELEMNDDEVDIDAVDNE